MTKNADIDLDEFNERRKRVVTRQKRRYVVVRTYSAGVHVGELVRLTGREVVLANASRIWRWRGANTLHEIALRGVDASYSRISEQVPEITLTEAIEIIQCSAAAEKILREPVWNR